MAKLYYPNPDELRGAIPQASTLWYRENKLALIALLNTNEGRDLFEIAPTPYPIIEVDPYSYTENLRQDAGPGVKRTTTRTAPKISNLIRFRLNDILPALTRIKFEQMMEWPLVGAARQYQQAVFATVEKYPDPHPETSTVDGRVRNSVTEDDWSVVRDAATGTGADPSGTGNSAAYFSAGGTSTKWVAFSRYFALFDVTAISDSDTVTSATFEMVMTGITDNYSQSIVVCTTTPASNTNLVTGDFNQVGTADQSTRTALSSLTVDDATYNALTLNSTGIGNVDLSGNICKFGIRLSGDIDDDEPTWAFDTTVQIQPRQADDTGTSKDPKLVVTHSTPSSYAAGILVI